MKLFYFTFDFQNYSGTVHGVACNGDGLVEAADVVCVVAHLDAAGFAWHDGLFGP